MDLCSVSGSGQIIVLLVRSFVRRGFIVVRDWIYLVYESKLDSNPFDN